MQTYFYMSQTFSMLSPLKPVMPDFQFSSVFQKLSESYRPAPHRFSNRLLKEKMLVAKQIQIQFAPLQKMMRCHNAHKSDTFVIASPKQNGGKLHGIKTQENILVHQKQASVDRRPPKNSVNYLKNSEKNNKNFCLSSSKMDKKYQDKKEMKKETRQKLKRLKPDKFHRPNEEANKSAIWEKSRGRKSQRNCFSKLMQFSKNNENINCYCNYYRKSIEKEIKSKQQNKQKQSFNQTFRVSKWQPLSRSYLASERNQKYPHSQNEWFTKSLQKSLVSFNKAVTIKKHRHLSPTSKIISPRTLFRKLPTKNSQDSPIQQWETQNTFFQIKNRNNKL